MVFAGDYHGQFDEVLVRAAVGPTDRARPRSRPASRAHRSTTIVLLDYGTAEASTWIRDHADDLAAVLVEPVQSRHPELQPRDFLQRGARDHRGRADAR